MMTCIRGTTNGGRLLAIALLAAVTAVTGCGSAAAGQAGADTPGTIVIGEPEALSGADAAVGEALHNGYLLAAREANARGGLQVGGRRYKVDLVTTDYASDVTQAPGAVQQLLTQDNARILLGPNLSLAFGPAATILSRSGDLVLTTTAALVPHLGAAGFQDMFALSGTGSAGANATAAVVRRDFPGVTTAALLFPGDDSGVDFRRYYTAAFRSAGIRVVYSQLYPDGTTDYTAQLTAMRADHPGILVTGDFDAQVAPIVTEALQLGATKIFAVAGSASPVSAAGHESVPGFAYLYGISGPVLSDPTPGVRRFSASFARYLGRPPTQPLDYLSAVTHDGLALLLAAMQQAGTTTDIPRIVATMPRVRSYPDDYLGMSFPARHIAAYLQYLGVIRAGRETYVPISGAR
jgi:branched-chain amino acid transport system substrate-binding protein